MVGVRHVRRDAPPRSRSGSGKCAGCPSKRQTARVQLTVEWPGGGIRLVEMFLCGACTFALLDLVDTGAMKVGVQTSLPFDSA